MKSSADFREILETNCWECLIELTGWRKEWVTNSETGKKELWDSPILEVNQKYHKGHEPSTRWLSVSTFSRHIGEWNRSLQGRWYHIKRAWKGYYGDSFEFYTKDELDEFIAALQRGRDAIWGDTPVEYDRPEADRELIEHDGVQYEQATIEKRKRTFWEYMTSRF